MGGLLDLTANNLRDELGGELSKSTAGGFTGDDISHLLSDRPDLGRGSICGLLDLVWSTLGEGDGEEAEEVVISGLDSDVGLNQGLPFSYKRSELV